MIINSKIVTKKVLKNFFAIYISVMSNEDEISLVMKCHYLTTFQLRILLELIMIEKLILIYKKVGKKTINRKQNSKLAVTLKITL